MTTLLYLSTLVVILQSDASDDRAIGPHAVLTNGELTMTVCLPGMPTSYYQGPRFDASSCVASVTYKNHTWFGDWQKGKQHNPHHHDDITGIGGEFGMGTTGLPGGLGYTLARDGGPFLKIGVGVLLRNKDPYGFFRAYTVETAPNWQTRIARNSVEYSHVLSGPNGYAYRLSRVIKIAPDGPAFTVTCDLENTGEKPILQSYYSHNFFIIDSQPMGPDYVMTLPFPARIKRDMKGFAEMRGNKLHFLKAVENGTFTELTNFDPTNQEHNQCKVENTRTRAWISFKGDSPLHAFQLYFTPATICPEPFIRIALKPGASKTWTEHYEVGVDN